MILSIATGTGLQKAIEEKISGFQGHLQLISYDLNVSLEQSPIHADQPILKNTGAFPEIKRFQKFGNKAGIIRVEDLFEGVVLKGVGADFDWRFFESGLVSGRLPDFSTEAASQEILLSKALQNILSAQLGDTIRMFFFREAPRPPLQRIFKIVGVYNTGLEEFDKVHVIGDFRHVQRLNNWEDHEIGGYELFVDNVKSAPFVAEKMRDYLEYAVDAVPIQESHEQMFQWLKLFDVNILIIIVIVLAVGAINIIVALLILILESTRTIGILKALGGSNRLIAQVFLFRSLQIILKGVLVGNAIGLGVAYLQKSTGFIRLNPEIYYVEAVPIEVSLLGIVILNIGTIIFSAFVLLIPARFISGISPAKTLRFQ
jgi:lipoprotein-releasing system permease protein